MLPVVTQHTASGSTIPLPNGPSRPVLSSINTQDQDDDTSLFPTVHRDYAYEQQISQQLTATSSDLLGTTSVPDLNDSMSFSQPDVTQTDLSMSPAAMFLSSFSPSSTPAKLPDSEGEIVGGYRLGSVVGVGGFSTVRRAYSLQGGTVAVKIIRRSDLSRQADSALVRKRLDHEAEIWSSLSHEHILPLFSVNQTLHADYFFTLYCPAGSLFDILKRDGRPALPQDDAGMMFRQVVRGLRYLHEVAGVVHGDMKLENVLVDEMGVCRITDFGMARRVGERDEEGLRAESQRPERDLGGSLYRHVTQLAHSRRSHSKQGPPLPSRVPLIHHHGGSRHRNSSPLPASNSPLAQSTRAFQPGSLPYASPELLLPPTTTQYSPSPAQDIWAVGVMLYALLTGRLPFVDPYEPRLQMKILHGVYDMPVGIGHGAERVLQGCLERSVPNRWTITMVDEVAWGVGCAEAGDDIPPSDLVPSRVPSKSRSRSRPGVQFDSAAIEDEESVRSSSRARSTSFSHPAARRRSVSRHVHHPYEHIRHHEHHHAPLIQRGGSISHPQPTEPTFSELTDAILRSSSVSSSESSRSVHMDSAILMTPSHSQDSTQERGRLPLPRSRWLQRDFTSPSPSISPCERLVTPRDVARRQYTHFGMEPSEKVEDGAAADDFVHVSPDLGVRTIDDDVEPLEDRASWATASEDGSQAPRSSANGLTAREQLQQVLQKDAERHKRSGSVPPSSASPASWRVSLPPSTTSLSTPKPIPRRPNTRSHSVDIAHNGT